MDRHKFNKAGNVLIRQYLERKVRKMQQLQDRKVSFQMNAKIIHALIGVAIMFIIPLLPIPYPDGTVTEVGKKVLGVFIGTLYLWTTTDPLWCSILSAVALAFTGYMPMGGILKEWFGNPTVVQLFFIMAVTACLTHEKITNYIGRFFLTLKCNIGRPWVFTTMILLCSYLMSVFIGCFVPILLFWPIMKGIYGDLGYTSDEKYPKLMNILIVVAALLGFPVPPYMSNGLALLSNYRGIDPNVVINDGKYFITCFVLGLIELAAAILITKFVLRPNVDKLKDLTLEKLESSALPPMNLRQKLIFGTFVLYVVVMLVPSLLPGIPLMQFLNANSLGFAALYVGIMGAIVLSDGRPAINFIPSMQTDFAWSSFFICTTAILLGGVLTNEATGVAALLGKLLAPIFNGMSPIVFTIAMLMVAFVLTNICNSLVIGMLLQPVIFTYATAAGINAAPFVTLLIFFVLQSAMLTPAASPFAAMMFANKDLKSSDVYKYAAVYAAVEVVLVLGLGIPFANLMMG